MGLIKFLSGGEEYSYHDTPDGEDCGQKLGYVAKYSAAYGICVAGVDVLRFSQPKGYAATLARMACVTLPIVGAGAAFVITTCIATNLRKKDDPVNYAIGGASIGAIVGATFKSVKKGTYSAFALAAFMAAYKHCVQNNYPIFYSTKPPVREVGDFWTPKRDYSLLKDPSAS